MKQKHLAVALSAIFAAAALTGCGSDSDSNFNYQPEVPETPETPETPEVPEVPEVPSTEDNVGDAASGITDLNKTATVGGQQYKRGETANFDRTLNPAATGNETVLNSKRLQNEKLDNIVLGRETVKRLDQDEAVLRLAGEAVDGFSNNTSNTTLGLQQHNGTSAGAVETRTKLGFVANGNTQYYTADKKAVAGVKFNYSNTEVAGSGLNSELSTAPTSGYPLYDENGVQLKDSTGAPLFIKATTNNRPATTGNNILVSNNVANVRVTQGQQQAGLVTVDVQNNTGATTVRGQEDTTGLRPNVSVDGSIKTTRFFGKNYRDTVNTGNNSYRFTQVLNDKNEYVTNPALGLEEAKLNHVQYGRVTSNIDKLDAIATIGKDGTIYYQSEIATADSRVPNGTPGEVDTYFYRGTGETSTTDMGKFFDNKDNIAQGTVSYTGHAVMYGIDNTYHGNKGNPDTNAPGNAEIAKQGVGNLVQANVDIGKREINGSIFNVWTLDKSGKDVYRKDDLVTFGGKINGNTAKGESQLAYGSKDKGAFKGSFFGPNAEEFGGSVNSIDDGLYGNAAWGGVFGTQKVTQVIKDSNANQTE